MKYKQSLTENLKFTFFIKFKIIMTFITYRFILLENPATVGCLTFKYYNAFCGIIFPLWLKLIVYSGDLFKLYFEGK